MLFNKRNVCNSGFISRICWNPYTALEKLYKKIQLETNKAENPSIIVIQLRGRQTHKSKNHQGEVLSLVFSVFWTLQGAQ